MEKIISPLTLTEDVKLIQRIPSKDIIHRYKRIFNIDIANYFTETSSIDLYLCNKSGYKFYYPFGIGGDDYFYQQLQNMEGYYPAWKWEFDVAFKLISANTNVLEIGCGKGNFLNKLKEKANCIGLEINTDTVQNGDITIVNQTIEEYSIKHHERFDWVISFQVLEHVENVRSFIESSLKALKKGGKMLVAVPNNESFFFKHPKFDFDDSLYQITLLLNMPPHHMGQWTEHSFRMLEKYFPIKAVEIIKEPLLQWRRELNLKIIKNKTGLLGNLFHEFFKRKRAYRMLSLVNSDFKYGDTLIAVFEKQ